jgi:hypothetical protein
VRHANARDPQWSRSRILELARKHETELRREMLQYVAPGDLDRAIDMFLDIRLADYMNEVLNGMKMFARQEIFVIVSKMISGEVPAPPSLAKVSSDEAFALAEGILRAQFGSRCHK